MSSPSYEGLFFGNHMTEEGDQLADRALASHRAGKHQEARILYERSLKSETKHRYFVLVNLGFLELANGESSQAIKRATEAIQIQKTFRQAYELKASAAIDLGMKRTAYEAWQECLKACRESLSVAERSEVCASIYCIATELGEKEAVEAITSDIRLDDLTGKGLKNLVWALILQGEMGEAGKILGDPSNYQKLEPFDQAVLRFAYKAKLQKEEHLEKVLSQEELSSLRRLAESNSIEMLLAITKAASVIGRHDLVLEILEIIGKTTTDQFEWLALAGDAHFSHGDLESSEKIYELVTQHPDFLPDRLDHKRYELDLARCRLGLGDFSEETWALYERRIDVVFQEKYTLSTGRLYPQLPRWSPDVQYQHILLTHEQGLGDQILFTTLIPAFKKSYPELTISLEVHPKLGAWTKKRFTELQVYTTGQSIPEAEATFDSVLFLSSIAQYIKTVELEKHLNSIKNSKTDLRRIGKAGKPRIGLYWRSSDSNLSDAKSVNLNLLEPLRQLGVEWVCLQDRIDPAECQQMQDWPMTMPAFDLRDDLESLEDLMQSLDGVVTISTTVAHMASAMGLPTWVMLSEKDGKKLWCWGHAEDDCRFYGSARLVRGLASSPEKVVTIVLAQLKKYLEMQ
jgi:tetratricopeptide (TPR) repeat protein